MNIYQMIKNSNCFTMTIFLMFKIKLVRLKGISGLKCPYAWVKNNVPSNFRCHSLTSMRSGRQPRSCFSLTEMTLSLKFPFHGEKGNLL